MVDELLAFDQPRPRFSPALAESLRRRMEEALGPVADALDRPLRVGKHDISSVHTCEAYFRAEKGSFAWAPRNSYGAIAHRALRLSVSLRDDPAPLDLVDMAIDAYVADDQGDGGLGRYLQTASPPTSASCGPRPTTSSSSSSSASRRCSATGGPARTRRSWSSFVPNASHCGAGPTSPSARPVVKRLGCSSST